MDVTVEVETLADQVLSRLIGEGLCTQAQESWYYVDDPRYYEFSVEVCPGSTGASTATGASFDRRAARIKMTFEAMERVALAAWTSGPDAHLQDCAFIRNEIPALAGEGGPQSVIVTPTSRLCPDPGRSTLPAQFVGVPYDFVPDECVLREPISTGAACATDHVTALLRGCLECIERDDFIRSFYSRKANHRVVFDRDTKSNLCWIEAEIVRCGLELHLIDIGSGDLAANTFLALIVDKTGISPALTAGAKSGTDAEQVARGAIEEALQGRTWLRDSWNSVKPEARQTALDIVPTSFLERGLMWASPTLLTHLSFYFDAPRRNLSSYLGSSEQTADSALERILRSLEGSGCSVHFVDLQHPVATAFGLSCLKVVVPELQPLFIDERYRILSGRRMPDGVPQTPTHFFL